MPEGMADGGRKLVTLDDLIDALDKRERAPSNVPKVETFQFKGDKVSDWLDLTEQALVGLSDEVKLQRVLRYVLHNHHREVTKVVDAAGGSWAKFGDLMRRKYRLGDGLLTMADLEAMNKEDFSTIGAFVHEFKKRARKVHGISEEAQCAMFLGLIMGSEATELTSYGEGSERLTWATIDKGVEEGSLDQVEQHQMRLQRRKRKERDATASGTPGVKRIVTDVLAALGYDNEAEIQKRGVPVAQGRASGAIDEEVGQEDYGGGETGSQVMTKAQRKQRNLLQGGQGSGKGQAPQAIVAPPPVAAAAPASAGPSHMGPPPTCGHWVPHWKEVVEVQEEEDEGDDEEDERLRQEEDRRAEQRAKKRGAQGGAEPILHDGMPKRKKYAVRLEEGFNVERMVDKLLEGHNDLMNLKDILASAPRLRGELKGRLSRRLVPNVHLSSILPREIEWTEADTRMDWKCVACGLVDLKVRDQPSIAMVDTGTEMNIIRERDATMLGLEVDHSDHGVLHGANCKAIFCGTASNVMVEIGRVRARTCFFVMPDVDHPILLGRSFLCRTETLVFNRHEGTMILALCDPACGNHKIIKCRNTGPESGRNRLNLGSFTFEESEYVRRRLRKEHEEEGAGEVLSLSLNDVNKAMEVVAAHDMADPEAIKVLREQAGPCRINNENEEGLIIGESGFLSPQERTLMVETMKRRHCAYAFNDDERGRLDVDKIPMIRMHTVLHELWNLRGARYPNPNEEKKVVDYLDGKIRTTLQWVQDLQRLNAVMVRDAGGLPNADALSESCAGRPIISLIDLYSGYDQFPVYPLDRPVTTMHTPRGLIHMNVAPQGWANAVAMVQRHMIRVMQTVNPHITQPYIDNLAVKGPKEKEEDEVMPGVRRFVWKHVQDIDQVLGLLEEHNLTASGPKSKHCMREATILGFVCNEKGRRPDVKKTDKILEWPVPFQSITDVRSFLGTCGFWRSFVKDFATKTEHLRKLRIPGDKNRADGLSRINWDGADKESIEDTPPVDGFLDQEEDVRLHINEWSMRVPNCVTHPIWLAPRGYEQKEELVLKPFQEEDPWGRRNVGWMMKLALTDTYSLAEEVRTIEEGPTQIEEHEQLMGGMYLLTNTLLQGSSDQRSSTGSEEGELLILESQDDEFEEGEIREAFRAEESDFSKAVMRRGGRDTRPRQRPQRMEGRGEQHEPPRREPTPEFDDDNIELFFDVYRDHAAQRGWSVAERIHHLRGIGRFEEPVAQICEEALTWPDVEAGMQRLRASPRGRDGMPIRLEEVNADEFIPAYEQYMLSLGVAQEEWVQALLIWTRQAEKQVAKQIRKRARDWEDCQAQLRRAFGRPQHEGHEPRVERRRRSKRLREPAPREVGLARESRRDPARQKDEPAGPALAEESFPACGLQIVEFRRITSGDLRLPSLLPSAQELDIPRETPFRSLATHLDVSQWEASRLGEDSAEPPCCVPLEEPLDAETETDMRDREEPLDPEVAVERSDPVRPQVGEVITVGDDTSPCSPVPEPGQHSWPEGIPEPGSEEIPESPPAAAITPEQEAEAEDQGVCERARMEAPPDLPSPTHVTKSPGPRAGRAPRETREEKSARVRVRLDEIHAKQAEMEAAGIEPTPSAEPKTSEQRIDELWARYESQRDAARQRSREAGRADEETNELREMGDLGFSATRQAIECMDRRVCETAVTSFQWYNLLSSELGVKELEVEHLTTQLTEERGRSQAREVEWERRFGEMAAAVDRLSTAWEVSQIGRVGADGQGRGMRAPPSQGAAVEVPRQSEPMEEVPLDAVEEEGGKQESLMAMSTERRGSRLHELATAMGIGTPQEGPQGLDALDQAPRLGELRAELGSWATETD
ncbi:hypothetical protein CBR_g8486 [Chara braunii]|uniref:Reverse transcriptase domain-containing protein n=1 Tax=Chara braunii TaxID=69332 RepID=A0A388KM99_CHABU|nr:hypothetical protein CBR_g8486 [Chara braunii]|eukprot:GBG71184.1 hypothetical protein CBR_g8486 [Chara braunii]